MSIMTQGPGDGEVRLVPVRAERVQHPVVFSVQVFIGVSFPLSVLLAFVALLVRDINADQTMMLLGEAGSILPFWSWAWTRSLQ